MAGAADLAPASPHSHGIDPWADGRAVLPAPGGAAARSYLHAVAVATRPPPPACAGRDGPTLSWADWLEHALATDRCRHVTSTGRQPDSRARVVLRRPRRRPGERLRPPRHGRARAHGDGV